MIQGQGPADTLRLVSAVSQLGSWSCRQCPRCHLSSTKQSETVLSQVLSPPPSSWDDFDSLTTHLKGLSVNETPKSSLRLMTSPVTSILPGC